MQSMRGAGRDIGVTQRCRQPFLRDRRKVVSVDEIMSDARMIGAQRRFANGQNAAQRRLGFLKLS